MACNCKEVGKAAFSAGQKKNQFRVSFQQKQISDMNLLRTFSFLDRAMKSVGEMQRTTVDILALTNQKRIRE